MRILVDGDGCPSKDIIVLLAKKYQKEMLVFIDYAHILSDDEYQVIMCEVGDDSVDMKIINMAKEDDIVITQDYGLASLVLPKKAKVLHVSGKIINDFNIDQLLMTRYLGAKQRKAGARTKGPAKRTKSDEQFFKDQLEKLLWENSEINLR